MGEVIRNGGLSQGSVYVQQPSPSIGAGAAAGVEDVKRLSGLAKDRALREVDARKGEWVSAIRGLAQSIEAKHTEGLPGQIAASALHFLQGAADKLDSQSTGELIGKARVEFRRRPGVAFAGLVALGFIAGRVLR